MLPTEELRYSVYQLTYCKGSALRRVLPLSEAHRWYKWLLSPNRWPEAKPTTEFHTVQLWKVLWVAVRDCWHYQKEVDPDGVPLEL